MPRSRSPDSIKAEEMYKNGMNLVDIAKEIGKPPGTVRRWKSTQGWDSERSEKKTNARKQETEQKEAIAPEVQEVINNPDLTDKQRLFCLQYVRCFNATKAAIKAGYSTETAYSIGFENLKKPEIKEEIQRLKQNRLNREMLSTEDIFQKYIDIAFADITDFITFGRETVQVMGAFGPVEMKDEETGKKVVLTKEINTVRFREYTDVDGTLISEVKQGKDGASIKLPDREKALRWLSEHMDMGTAEQREKVKLLQAQRRKLENDKEDEENDQVVIINDV